MTEEIEEATLTEKTDSYSAERFFLNHPSKCQTQFDNFVEDADYDQIGMTTLTQAVSIFGNRQRPARKKSIQHADSHISTEQRTVNVENDLIEGKNCHGGQEAAQTILFNDVTHFSCKQSAHDESTKPSPKVLDTSTSDDCLSTEGDDPIASLPGIQDQCVLSHEECLAQPIWIEEAVLPFTAEIIEPVHGMTSKPMNPFEV